jgi:hypothetical protein
VYILVSQKDGRHAMSKLNFQQTMPRSRDMGGVSSVIVLAFALVICLEWGLLLHVRL